MINFQYDFYNGYFDVFIEKEKFVKIDIVSNNYNYHKNIDNKYYILLDKLMKYNQKIDIKYIKFPGNTDFSINIYKELYKTNFNQTISYKELVLRVKNKKAYRAVGTLMKNNPLPVIIPCHRVIKSNGEIGNFGAGKEWKIALLNNEKKMR